VLPAYRRAEILRAILEGVAGERGRFEGIRYAIEEMTEPRTLVIKM